MVRDKLSAVKFLAERNIEAIPFGVIPHPGAPSQIFPDVDYLRAHLLEVPCHQDLRPEQINYLLATLRELFEAGF